MKSAEVAIIFIIGTLTLLVFVLFLVLIILEYRKRQVRYITEKLELKHQFQSEVLRTQLEVQEQSFKYISEEIHDNVAQALSLARIKLYKTAGKATDSAFKESIDSSNELVGKSLNDLRNLSHVLNGGLVSKLSLQESIEKELGYIKDVNELQCELAITGAAYEIDAQKKLLTFRIVQEAINNALKHGKAKKINIGLAYSNTNLLVTITDNGRGFDTTQTKDNKGLGLHNIEVRAKMLGTIDIFSVPGEGTTITLNVNTHG